MSRIVVFYSYKGGVGRTFAIANIAAILAKRGKRTLLMDWDVEAPGLHRYFKPYMPPLDGEQQGIIHLLNLSTKNPEIPWQSFIKPIRLPDAAGIDFIPSGDHASDYVEQIRRFSWNQFFESHSGGSTLNRWIREWKSTYDYILIDSRTGITDTSGVCTIYLPDILVLVFAPNEQSFDRGVQIVRGVQKARQQLSVPRPPLAILPVPGRFDGRDEIDQSQHWLDRFATELKVFYDDWLPSDIKPRQMIELTKVPYVTKYSFGEPLPVIDQGVSDPELPGFYLENVAKLLVSDFRSARQIVHPDAGDKADAVSQLRTLLSSTSIDEDSIESSLQRVERELLDVNELVQLLVETGLTFYRLQRFEVAEKFYRRALYHGERSGGFYSRNSLLCLNYLAELMTYTGRHSEAIAIYRQIIDADSELDSSMRPNAYTSLANAYRQSGRQNEAVTWYRRALEFLLTSDSPDSATLISAYANLASIHREMRMGEEAIQWYERALEVVESLSPIMNPISESVFNNLAGFYRELGRYSDAIYVYRRAIQLFESNLSESGRPISTIENYAGLLHEMGKREEALSWYNRALDMTKLEDRSQLMILSKMGDVCKEMGLRDEAISYFRKAIEISERKSIQPDYWVVKLHRSLAELYVDSGEMGRAIHLYMYALRLVDGEGAKASRGALLTIYNDLGNLYRKMGDEIEANSWYERGVFLSEEVFGKKSVRTVTQMANLADSYIELGRDVDAERLLRLALESLPPTLRDESSISVRIRGSLIRLLKTNGRTDEAEEMLRIGEIDVFISYRSENRNDVWTLAERLTERSFRVWFDAWEPIPGEKLLPAMLGALKSAGVVLVCMGSNGVDLRLFGDKSAQLDMIQRDDRSVIPVLFAGAVPEMVPRFLRKYQYWDFSNGLTEDGVAKLSEAINLRRKRKHDIGD